jgi:hypothetical protein
MCRSQLYMPMCRSQLYVPMCRRSDENALKAKTKSDTNKCERRFPLGTASERPFGVTCRQTAWRLAVHRRQCSRGGRESSLSRTPAFLALQIHCFSCHRRNCALKNPRMGFLFSVIGSNFCRSHKAQERRWGSATDRRVKLTTHLHLVPRSRKRGALSPLPHTYSWHGHQMQWHFTSPFLTSEYANSFKD